jgi:hypothetical protein
MQQPHTQRHKEIAQLAQEPATLPGQPAWMGFPRLALEAPEFCLAPFVLNAQIHEPFLKVIITEPHLGASFSVS